VVFGPDAAAVAQSAAMQQIANSGWQLLAVESKQNWGAATAQLVNDLMDGHAIAMLALDRNSAHLAEQMALKSFVPVVALAEDRTLTSTNVPWIFRLPAKTAPDAAFRLISGAEQQSGPNAERLRAALASGVPINGLAFGDTGEPRP
jgi:hypothetical protein